jgi:hypothetical protein
MTPYASEREVANFARHASAYLEAGRIRRFVRADRTNLLEQGRALSLRLAADCRRAERERAGLAERAGDPGVLERVNTLTQELHAGHCQLQRLSAILEELQTSGRAAAPNVPH